MQEHHFFVDIEASVDELWQLFWARIPHTQTADVTIDILHPGDAVGEGLVRHCTFRVPRYLLSGGKGQSWEWLTEVTPPVSWKYNAVGRPLWSEAEGRTRLEDLGNGTTRVHFSETYHAFNPVLRALLEKRVHAFISKDNDRLIKESLTTGVRYLRAAKAKAKDKATPADARRPGEVPRPGGRGRRSARRHRAVTVVDPCGHTQRHGHAARRRSLRSGRLERGAGTVIAGASVPSRPRTPCGPRAASETRYMTGADVLGARPAVASACRRGTAAQARRR